ncbi:MAG: prolipoprotein diacylglyceryl transferase [Phycisphaeraceae bacterium]|nr:prolipoprotein diacylglyceryl transferase [Phycisphaeraceae bacterium]
MLLLADPWLHNLDPFAIQLPGFVGDLLNGGVRWYGLSYLLGFVIGFFIIRRVLTAGVSSLKPEQTMDLVVAIAIGIVLGGRLGYVVFYQPSLFLDFGNSFPFWGVFKINQGGMASHGGIIGGAAGCVFFVWRQKMFSPNKTLHIFDLMAFGGPLGLFFGRIANFINGELFGRACPRDFPLAVQFPQEIAETWTPEQVADLRQFALDQGEVYSQTQFGALYESTLAHVQAGDAAWVAYLAEHLTPRYPSQLFAGLAEGVIVFVVLLILYRKPVKAGLIGGAFCVSYALMRVFNEFFRLPDSQFIEDGQLPAVTQGQLLSIGLFIFGVVTLVIALRSKQEKLGGWMQPKKIETNS